VIHEARFTYPKFGLRALADLGQWWESTTGHAIPLGAIIARRDGSRPELDPAALAQTIRASLDYGYANPESSTAFIAEHADEMDPAVQRQHIELYVNDFSRNLGEEGYSAAEELLDRACDAGLVPAIGSIRG
jgi:1,4-dihydroxy-6-naphthoate synthase